MEERKFETWQMIEAGKRDFAAGLRGSEVPFESWPSSVESCLQSADVVTSYWPIRETNLTDSDDCMFVQAGENEGTAV